MTDAKQQNGRLAALLLTGLIALNYPLLTLFSKVRLLWNIPVLYLYLFTVWYIFIVCVVLILAQPASPATARRQPRL
jgi:hypothetical protein